MIEIENLSKRYGENPSTSYLFDIPHWNKRS